MLNLQIGDVVLLVDEKTLRGLWPLGRIVDLKENQKDGSVTLKTKSTILERPIDTIILLEAAPVIPEKMK